MDRLKKWLFSEIEVEENFTDMKMRYYQLQNMDKLIDLANDLKHNYMILCYVDENIIVRVLGFIDGIIYIKDIQKIKITQNIYMFLPQNINYKCIS